MSIVQGLSIAAALGLCAGPVLWLRRPAAPGIREPPPPAVIRNGWIAGSLRLSVFAALFAAAAAGDLRPAIVTALAVGTGVSVFGWLRPRVTAWADEARAAGRPPTLPSLLSGPGEGGARLRVLAGLATAAALIGLAEAEAAALAIVLNPLLGGGYGPWLFAIATAAAVLLVAARDGEAVRFVAQALLGALYFGLFGAAAFVLYLHASDLRPLPPHGALALLVLAAGSIAILVYRQTQYCETPALVPPDDPSPGRRAAGRAVRQLLRIGNVVVSIFAVLVVVMVVIEATLLGLPDILRSAAAFLGGPPRLPAAALAGLALLAFAFPLADAVSWHAAGALGNFARFHGLDTDATPALFARPNRTVAGETALMGLLLAAFGAMAALATDLPPDALGLPDLVDQLRLFQHPVSEAALTFLLVGTVAAVAAAMSLSLSAALAVIRHDVLPTARAPSAPATLAGAAALVGAGWITTGVPSGGTVDARFLHAALPFACLQLALLPPLAARLGGRAASPGAALAAMGGGAAAGFACLVVSGTTDTALAPWFAAPACLGAGALILWLARLLAR